jgi:hypothetical protein
LTSSADLHPVTGARFVFERTSEAPLVYRVTVYLPERREHRCVVTWSDAGAIQLDPAPDEAAVTDEIVKLSRVLRREPKSRLVRWRGL